MCALTNVYWLRGVPSFSDDVVAATTPTPCGFASVGDATEEFPGIRIQNQMRIGIGIGLGSRSRILSATAALIQKVFYAVYVQMSKQRYFLKLIKITHKQSSEGGDPRGA